MLKKYEKLYYYATFFLIYLFFAALFFTFTSYYKIQYFAILATYFFAFALLYYISVNPLKIIVAGRKLSVLIPEVHSQLIKIINTRSVFVGINTELYEIQSNTPNVYLISNPHKVCILITSKALEIFNQLDFESIFAFFAAKIYSKNHLIDTIYLLLASLMERTIILKPIAYAFANMGHSYNERAYFDVKAIDITKNAIGYKVMLNKVRITTPDNDMPISLSAAAIFENSNPTFHKSDIDTRIEIITKGQS